MGAVLSTCSVCFAEQESNAPPGGVEQPRAKELYQQGLDAERSKEFDNALKKYNEAIHLDEAYADAYLKRGCIWLAKGDLEKAIADGQMIIEIAPEAALGYWLRGAA
jgi:tetratricopeptide (TPR) repeat protein